MATGILYIVRHAECQNNITKIILPPDEDVLTEHGKLQADLLGKHLADVKFTKVYSSDYARCVETTSHILSHSTHPEVAKLEINFDKRLRERNTGKFEGGPARDMMGYLTVQIFEKGIPAFEIEFPGGGDSSAEMKQRSESFFQEIFSIVDNTKTDSEGEKILAVSHGFAMWYLVNYLISSTSQLQLNNATEIISKLPSNTAFIKLGIHRKSNSEVRQVDVLAEHDKSHLVSLKKEDPIGSFSKGTKFEGCIHQ